jgi:hypothetical protein
LRPAEKFSLAPRWLLTLPSSSFNSYSATIRARFLSMFERGFAAEPALSALDNEAQRLKPKSRDT